MMEDELNPANREHDGTVDTARPAGSSRSQVRQRDVLSRIGWLSFALVVLALAASCRSRAAAAPASGWS